VTKRLYPGNIDKCSYGCHKLVRNRLSGCNGFATDIDNFASAKSTKHTERFYKKRKTEHLLIVRRMKWIPVSSKRGG
jgi:hypothetical protein